MLQDAAVMDSTGDTGRSSSVEPSRSTALHSDSGWHVADGAVKDEPADDPSAVDGHAESTPDIGDRRSPSNVSLVSLKPETGLSTARLESGADVCRFSPPVSPVHSTEPPPPPRPQRVLFIRQRDNHEVSRLQAELSESREANLALQEELSTRDFHLAQLAEDFYRLHEQFKQMAQHFQLVLGDIQRPQSIHRNSTANGFDDS
jgi:hypothetical protein